MQIIDATGHQIYNGSSHPTLTLSPGMYTFNMTFPAASNSQQENFTLVLAGNKSPSCGFAYTGQGPDALAALATLAAAPAQSTMVGHVQGNAVVIAYSPTGVKQTVFAKDGASN